jgi:hypothetical protein
MISCDHPQQPAPSKPQQNIKPLNSTVRPKETIILAAGVKVLGFEPSTLMPPAGMMWQIPFSHPQQAIVLLMSLIQ